MTLMIFSRVSFLPIIITETAVVLPIIKVMDENLLGF